MSRKLAGPCAALAALLCVGSGTRAHAVRMAGIGGNQGNLAANEIFTSGDLSGSIDRISAAAYNAMTVEQLRVTYDVLLVHGFGFAAVLVDARLARALVGFNTGVEVGQLAVVALVWPLLQVAIRRRGGLVEVGSAAVAGPGLFWFVTRAYG